MAIELYFPPLNGGKERGLNDAGVEYFEGDFRKHIVRECGQNALDARLCPGRRVLVKIQIRQIPKEAVPGIEELRAAVDSVRRFWRGDPKTDEFCRKALAWTEGPEIDFLEVADYGTTGLEGDENDRNGSWFGLVLAEGVSNKGPDAAGAFGIGKDAPFAGSFIRTVFYSTLNRTGGHAFQGVAKLATHLDPQGRKTQNDGFIGLVDRQAMVCRAVRERQQIPEVFRRNELGTSIFVAAYKNLAGTHWADEFIRHAVENFWPAIHREELVFEIDGYRVDASTLPDLVSRYSSDADFTTAYYYKAAVSRNRLERTTDLRPLGRCRVCLITGDATYPRKVCMTRQTGMVIYEASRFRSYRPFAGLFVCESQEGNAYLRGLEPPRHDAWDPKRAQDENEAKSVIKRIRDWINACLRELNPETYTMEADVPELNRYLPDDQDEPLDDLMFSHPTTGHPDRPLNTAITHTLTTHEVPPSPPFQLGQGMGAPLNGNEDGAGQGEGRIAPENPESEQAGGHSPTTGGGATGFRALHAVRVPLKTRSLQLSQNTYRLILRSSTRCSGMLRIVCVGEDNKEEKDLTLLRALEPATGKDLLVEKVTIEPGQPLRVEVDVASTIPVSLRAYCHGD